MSAPESRPMATSRGARRLIWRLAVALLLGAGVAVSVVRFGWGLGAVTNLHDGFPWGLWVAVDVMGGVALAAGGFTITFLVYILDLKELKPIVRPTLLTAFLGYLLVCVGLLYDLGKPWNIWHAIVFWNPRSVMFEVAWCVMIYTGVLALELAEPVLERLGWKRLLRLRRAVTVLLVGAGVILSTLHQSSLGSVFLIAEGKLHPLWYTPQLPVLFFASAVMVAFAVVLVESALSRRYLGHGLPDALACHVGFFLMISILLYLLLRVLDLVARDAIPLVFAGTLESGFFAVEILLLVLAAAVLVAPLLQQRAGGLVAAGSMVVLSVLLHRFNVSLVGYFESGGVYWPAWTEVLITVFIVALGVIAFGLAARWLPVFHHGTEAAAPLAGDEARHGEVVP